VFQLGQPRIWMAMSRDGLLPKIFAAVHPRFKTPWFSTLVSGALVAIPSLFMNLTEVTDLTSIGTLFAFVLVCGGVLILDKSNQKIERKFRVPYINSKFIMPAALLIFIAMAVAWTPVREFMINAVTVTPAPGETALRAFSHKIPFLVFCVGTVVLTVLCFLKDLSLIPVLGLLTCGYLMTELGIVNWTRFLIWLAIGLVIYFLYGFSHSRLNAESGK
jgi:amino acid transporter